MTPLVPLKVDLRESGLYIAASLTTCPKSPPTKNFIHLETPLKQKTTNNFSPQPLPAHQALPAVLQRQWWIQETFKIFHHSRPICSIDSDRRDPGKKSQRNPKKINQSIYQSIHPSINPFEPFAHCFFFFWGGGRRFPQLSGGLRFSKQRVVCFYSPH